jgi:uncharacterized membrane protein
LKVLRTQPDRLLREDDAKIVLADEGESPPRPTPARAGPPSVRTDIEGGKEMTKIERSIVIDRPIAEVWGFVHDTTKDASWQTTLRESEVLTDGPMGVGTRVREVRQFLGVRVELAWELTEYEPSRTSSIQGVSGPLPLSGSYLLEPVTSGTKFTVMGELDAHGLFKLAEPVFARMTARELEANLGHLKDLLEAAEDAS